MATPGLGNRLITKGQYVLTEGRTCYVENIDNQLGFNIYYVIDIDSGVYLKKSRWQLEPTDLKIDEADDIVDTPQQEKKETTEKKRFLSLKEEEINQIEQNRTCYRTKKQTAWAVTILKGR